VEAPCADVLLPLVDRERDFREAPYAIGPEVEMPYNFQQLGWEGDEFSARRALDRLEKYVMLERRQAAEVCA
jgi:hypothetical protein